MAKPRITGGPPKIILPGAESNFKQVIASQNEGTPGNKFANAAKAPVRGYGNTNISRDSILKTASYLDVTRNAPLFNDPRYTSSTLSIPTDNRTLHGLYRFFTETDPIVGASLKMHSELPLANVALGTCEDEGIQRHFDAMWDRINGTKLLTDMVSEYYEIGDCFPFGAFNETDYMWDQFAILNPDYVKIESTWLNQNPLIKLIPDENLKKIVQTRSPRFIYDQLPQEIVRYVLFNREIPLDPNNVFHISHAKRPYELRGRSLIKRILKTLMLEDRFNQANFALATRHAVPLTVVKVGDPTTGWTPNEEELNAVRDLFAAWELDPNFSIFYHYGIDVQFYGSNGRALPVGPELDRIYRLKFIGLQVHEQLLAGGGGSYSQAYINLEVQRQRYLNLQLKLEQFLHEGLFKPVADLCGFYRVHNSTTSGHGGVKKYSYGKEDDFQKRLLKQFTTLRDLKDNEEFLRYVRSKLAEYEENTNKQEREYVFPKIDWGAMSAASDENLKNYVKWLSKERPYLIDDATLARLAKLDRDTQEDAYIEDLRRAKTRFTEVNKEGLLPFAQSRTGKGGGDFGGDVGMPLDMGGMPAGGGPGAGGLGEGEVPNVPAGAGGPPETAGGQVAPAGTEASIKESTVLDDRFITSENKSLLKEKENWSKAIAEAIIIKPE